MLKVKDLNVFYGGIHALKGVGLEVNDGEIVTIIGSNVEFHKRNGKVYRKYRIVRQESAKAAA